jgi:hypothetical protein
MLIADYINKFKDLRNIYAIIGAIYIATVEMPTLVKDLIRRYKEKVYKKLNK